jgi:hypothetical protein
MSDTNVGAGQAQDNSVEGLVRQRDQLRGWIARLDEVSGQAASHVTQRVRGDYEARLRRVTEELAAHVEEIERDLADARSAVAAAEETRTQAGDRLEEHRLRHIIGELADDAWEAQRPGLEGEVSGADDALSRARAELERLEALAAEVSARPAEPEPPPAAAPPPPAASAPSAATAEPPAAAEEEDEVEWEPEVQTTEPEAAAEPPASGAAPAEAAQSADDWDPFGGEFGVGSAAPRGDATDELPWLEDLERTDRAWDGAGGAGDAAGGGAASAEAPGAGGADLGEDDLAFLEELDRAISSSPAPAPAPAAAPSAPEGPGAAPPAAAPGTGAKAEPLLCKECGAINEPHAWYCEICGSEL